MVKIKSDSAAAVLKFSFTEKKESALSRDWMLPYKTTTTKITLDKLYTIDKAIN